MYRRVFLWILTFLVVFSSYCSAQSNLLSNPNFENGLNSWTVLGPNWLPQNAVVREGSISVQNTIGTIPNQDYFASLYQEFPALATQQFWATVQAKTNINVRANARAGVLIEFLTASNVVIGTVQDETGGVSDWQQLYATATAPVNTAKVRLHAYVFASQLESQAGGIAVGGLAYFDQAVLSATVIPPPTAPAFPLNAGFENGFVDWNRILAPSFSVDDQNFSQGAFSAKSTIDLSLTPNQDFFAASSQDLRYLTGPVFASAQVRTALNPASSALAELKLEFYDRFNPPSSVQPLGFVNRNLRGVNNWTRVVIDGTGSGVTPPSGTVMIRVSVLTFATRGNTAAQGGIANFDDVILSYSPLPPNNRTNVLNRGFENGLNDWSDQFGFPSQVSTIARSGVLSAQNNIGVLPNNQDYFNQTFQDIYFDNLASLYPTGTNVYASTYIRTAMNPTTKAIGGLQFEFIDSSGNVIRNSSNVPITVLDKVGGVNNEWRYAYITAKTPAGAQRVRVSGITFSRRQETNLGGSSNFDDFAFSKTTALPPPAQRFGLGNPGFENGLADYWNEPFKQGEITAVQPHSGNYAAEFTVDNIIFTTNYFGLVSQPLRLNGNNLVGASGWVKTNIDPLTFSVAGILLRFFDSNNQQLGPLLVQFIGGQTNWTKLTIAPTFAPAGAIQAEFSFFLYAPFANSRIGDKAYFDDGVLSIGVPIAQPCMIGGQPC